MKHIEHFSGHILRTQYEPLLSFYQCYYTVIKYGRNKFIKWEYVQAKILSKFLIAL